MPNHPNQTFAMHNDWRPDANRLAEVLWFKFQLNTQLSEEIFSSDWYQQKLNEFRFEQKNRFDEYLDQKKNNEYGWMLEFGRMLKQGYISSRRVNEQIQQGRFVEKDPHDPQHSNIKKLLADTQIKQVPQATSSQAISVKKEPIFIPESVDKKQLDRFVEFFIELTQRNPLRSQMETWISQLAIMNATQQNEQINYAISIGKTVIYPPRPELNTSSKAGGARGTSRTQTRDQKAALEQEKHQLNVSFNGIRLAAHIHRAALTAFIDERFSQEKKAMTPTRLQALVDMLSSMNNDEQATSIRQAIIGNYKTIYAPKPNQQAPRTAMQAAQDAANKMKQQTGDTSNTSVNHLKNRLFLNKSD